jgi:hypothetical protein
MHENEFINFAKSDNLFASLSFSEDHDENMSLLMEAPPLIGRRKSVSTGSGRRQKRKNKVKSLAWISLTDIEPSNDVFVELITNRGKKIAKKKSIWIDKNGDKLECKIIKWRKNENYKSNDI